MGFAVGCWLKIGGSHLQLQHTTTAIKLEVVEQGIQIGKKDCLTKIKAQTDSTNVVSFLEGKHQQPWELRNTTGWMKKLIGQLDSFEIKHIYRKCNKLADAFAATIPKSWV
ncbi:hypothetical protein FRX31_024643 [Thalictrum thalictroides]|uniref:RNase H type-1 domain-containing protein n=1 Tax=Thalictrum thalictroides TaxID=46969 RepID=A0A7J6VNN1_THATH|nr:hypothetical protein FRX31_024643 [Thalictrum thalictroides]